MLLDFLFSSVIPKFIQEFIKFLCCRFGSKIIPKFIGNKFVALNNCSLFYFDLFFGQVTRQDIIDM